MDGMCGAGDFYADKALMSPENLMMAAEYGQYQYDNLVSGHRIPGFESEELGYQCSAVSESASINVGGEADHGEELASGMIKARIASHPSYPKLLDAYIDCQKVGAPPEIACVLDEIRREKDVCKHDVVSMCFGVDPELDEFMETYCDVLVKYKTDLSRPFDEATSFLNKIETQLGNLSKAFMKAEENIENRLIANWWADDGGLSSDEELSGGEAEANDLQMKTEDRELKDRLLRLYGNHINSLKHEFSKKKKKGKLPKDARQKLLEWWNVHYKWPYPTEMDKVSLAETTGLDQKQINNWFINQRKRHWKPSENMHLAMMENLSGHLFIGD